MTPEEVKRDLRIISKKRQMLSTIASVIDSNHMLRTSQNKDLNLLCNDYEVALIDLLKLELQYTGYIRQLDFESRCIVVEHYINGEPLWRTANKFNYGNTHICRVLDRAVQNIAFMSGYKTGQ